jgi:hypothetical protein
MATQEQHWERVKEAASQGLPYCSCLLDLRAKVEALEAKLASPPCILVPSISDEQLESLKQPGRIEVLEPGDQMAAPAPAGGLMERVGADAIWLTDEKLDEPCHSSGDDLLKTYCDARRAFYFEAAEGESDQGDRKAAAIAGLRAVIAADRARLGREHGAAANSKPTPNDRQIGSLSDALIKAECALADIAEGEPTTDEGDPLKWNQQRCADTLSIIRPVMQQHKIRTSEWMSSGFNPPQPLPAPAGELVERVADVIYLGTQSDFLDEARAAIREVVAFMRENDLSYWAANRLEQEANR